LLRVGISSRRTQSKKASDKDFIHRFWQTCDKVFNTVLNITPTFSIADCFRNPSSAKMKVLALVSMLFFIFLQSRVSIAEISCYACQGYSGTSSFCYPNTTVNNAFCIPGYNQCVATVAGCQACITQVFTQQHFDSNGVNIGVTTEYTRGCETQGSSSTKTVCVSMGTYSSTINCLYTCNTNLCNGGNDAPAVRSVPQMHCISALLACIIGSIINYQ